LASEWEAIVKKRAEGEAAAEYAIALGLKHMTRVIYTSPIKTLSNQKFGDFRKRFGEDAVGILTGDVQIRPTASCLVMTTEILRTMLYRGADVLREVEWVVFDEVHYVNDWERGVVWEEVLILLPRHVHVLMLSATVPNAVEFAEWIGRIRTSPVHVITTFRRPVPLEHFLVCRGERFRVVDDRSVFQSHEYRRAADMLKEHRKKNARFGSFGRQRGGESLRSEYNGLVEALKARDQLPAVLFCFSKKKTEEIADALSHGHDDDLMQAQHKPQLDLVRPCNLHRLDCQRAPLLSLRLLATEEWRVLHPLHPRFL
jgi:antiviral helicase SKI2